MLKQPLCHPMSLHDQVISLVAANNRLLLDVEVSKIKGFQKEMLAFFEQKHPEIVKEIEEKKVLTDELKQSILDGVKEFKQNTMASF